LPHAFIFFRDYFEHGRGRAVREEYEGIRRRMTRAQEEELVRLLAGPPHATELSRAWYVRHASDGTVDATVRAALRFHVLDSKERAKMEGERLLEQLERDRVPFRMPSNDEIVEDAGLYDAEAVENPAGRLTVVST